MNKKLILGVGNRYRRDDGVGPAVIDRLPEMAGVDVCTASGEGVSLMHRWQGYETVMVIDAVSSGGQPGTLYCFDISDETLPVSFFHYSSHAFGLAEAVEMARVLNWLPPDLIVFGVEGQDFGSGEGLSPAVAAVLPELVQKITCNSAFAC